MIAHFLFDSAFANGAYSHSFGMETYISWGLIKDAASYQKWLERYMLNVFAPSEGAIYLIANEFKNKKISLLKLAKVANLSIASFESRNASINMAKATLKNTEFMHNDLAKWYFKICEKNENFIHPAIAFSVLSNDNLICEYTYSCIKNLTQNATRAVPLSYKKSSELLYKNINLAKLTTQKSYKIAEQIINKGYFSLNDDLNSLFSTHQELDIAMFGHENLDFRLFMS